VHQFALAETLEAENFRVRGEGISRRDLISVGRENTNDAASLVDGSVLVELVNIDLEVLSGLGETERIKAAVAGKRAIQPIGADSVGEPEGFASCKEKSEHR
jgi:hypothetical protein